MSAATMPGATVPQDAIERAIAWAVKLESGTTGMQEFVACQIWRDAHPLHEQAWQQVQQIEQTFRAVPAGKLAHRALEDAARQRGVNTGRRRSLQLIALGTVGIASGLFAALHAPWQQRASYLTAVGERRRLNLADGTQLTLNTDTQTDVVFSPLRRLIDLRQGEILIDTGRDAESLTGRRPFWVQTAQIRMEAIGTRFAVRNIGGETRLSVIEGQVDVHPPTGQRIRVSAGQAVVFASAQTDLEMHPDSGLDPAAWADGVLIAKQMRLDDFVAELSRYQTAPLRCDEAVASLRVSGVFQLSGAAPVRRALNALTATLPVAAKEDAPGSFTLQSRLQDRSSR